MYLFLFQDITCETLPSVENGTVWVFGGSDGALVAKYECEEGFVMIGPCERTCQCNGQWQMIDNETKCLNGTICVL